MLYVISGCSCGGKTTLTNALLACGHRVSDEPGLKVVREELDSGGSALPWVNPVEFAEKCLELSVQQYADATRSSEVVFFDRSLVDAVSALVYEVPDRAEPYMRMLAEYRYADTVFMAPPWPEHFVNDSERRHTFEDSIAEYDRLVVTYLMAGYSIQTLPRQSVPERIAFIHKHIDKV